MRSLFGPTWLVLLAVGCSGGQFTTETDEAAATGGGGGTTAVGDSSESAGGRVTGEAGGAQSGGATLARGGTSESGGATAAGGAGVGGDLAVGGTTSIGGAGGSSAGGAGGTTVSGTAGMGGVAPATSCPDETPDLTAPCTSGLVCTYGGDRRPGCRFRYECHGGAWQKTIPVCEPIADCSMVEPSSPLVNAACPEAGFWCAWEVGLICGCVPCEDASCAASAVWDCRPAPSDPCPLVPPDIGALCESGDVEAACTYGFCGIDFHYTATCIEGAWSVEDADCP